MSSFIVSSKKSFIDYFDYVFYILRFYLRSSKTRHSMCGVCGKKLYPVTSVI